ncbi:FDLD family class I lanthipeptide [Ktedonospora formicarum]
MDASLLDLDIQVETMPSQATITTDSYTTQCNCTSSTSCIDLRPSCPDD